MTNFVRGGNSGFIIDDVVYDGASGCLRRVLLRHHGIEEPTEGVDPVTGKGLAADPVSRLQFALGYSAEETQSYIIRKSGIEVDEDVEVISPITEKTSLMGHSDAVAKAGQPYAPVYEYKSVNSPSRMKETMIDGGSFKWGHLAQLFTYMVARKNPLGELRYMLMFRPDSFRKVIGKTKDPRPKNIYKEYKLSMADVKIFYARIKKDGYLHVGEGKDSLVSTGVHIKHIKAHNAAKAKVVEENMVWFTRPESYESEKPGCMFCPFQATCDKWDQGEIETTEEFLDSARQEMNMLQLQEVELNPEELPKLI